MSRLVERLIELIGFPTQNPDGDEPRLAARLRDELAARGADSVEVVEVARPAGNPGAYVLARWGEPRLLVNAHLDTVPPNAGWPADPFTARVSDDGKRVHGLGAADTKGAIACVLDALEDVRPADTAVLFSGDEEHGGACLRELVLRGLPFSQAIVCEPTALAVGTRHRGIISVEARRVGEGGHSSRADHLPRPLAELARLAVAFDDWGEAQRTDGPPGFPGLCLNVAKLDGGVAFNVVPEEARLTVSLRPPPGSDMAALREQIRALVATAASSATLRFDLDNPPFATRALEEFRPWLGARADAPVDLAFWTEAAVLAEAGVDAVVFGPGRIEQAHAPDEWVAVDELDAARAAFAEMFHRTRTHHGTG